MDARVTTLERQYGRIESLRDSIDRRLGRLESRYDTLDMRVRRVEIDVGEVKGRLMNIPSTRALVTTIIGGQIALAGMLFTALRYAGAY